jgi:hypothetical protein
MTDSDRSENPYESPGVSATAQVTRPSIMPKGFGSSEALRKPTIGRQG